MSSTRGSIEAELGRAPGRPGDRRRGIDRTIGLLELLVRRRRPMAAGDIARAMNAPRSTIYEIINRLTEAQMIEPIGPDGQIYFGPAMQIFGAAYLQRDARARRIRTAMDALAARSGATVQLCAARGNKYTVVDCRDGSGAFRITSEVGVEVPLPWTASGRLLLGHLTDDAILALLPEDDFRLPDGTTLPFKIFLDDVALARRQGYAETTGLASSYTWCLAVPLRDALERVDLTLCFVLPVDTSPDDRAWHLAMLKAQASAISQVEPVSAPGSEFGKR